MIPLEKTLKNDRLMRALTGLTAREFTALAPAFEQTIVRARHSAYTANPDRRRRPGGGKKGIAPTAADKLFFILLYYKCYPTYDVMGFLYGCDRSAACKRQQQLSRILQRTLKRKLTLPRRRMRSAEEFLAAFPEAREVFVDGTERPIQRPKHAAKQRSAYSGKKKRHTRKNLVISTAQKRIGFLSRTAGGREHDMSMLKNHAPPRIVPKSVRLHADLGFKGLDTRCPDLRLSLPQRKPRTRDLTAAQEARNRRKARIRVLVEHAIGGVKRFGIVSQVFRNKKDGSDDTAMLIACGLWNYHLAMR